MNRAPFATLGALMLALTLTGAALLPVDPVHLDPSGVTVLASRGAQHWVRLQVYAAGAIRVTEAPSRPAERPSLMVVAQPATSGFTVTRPSSSATVAVMRVVAKVTLP